MSAATAHADVDQESTVRLFEAVETNNLALAQASVAAGADIQAKDGWGLTPLERAIDQGYFEIAHFLASVRNFRQQTTPQVTPPSLAPSQIGAAPMVGSTFSLPAETSLAPALSAGKPDPFAPDEPVFGGRLDVQTPDSLYPGTVRDGGVDASVLDEATLPVIDRSMADQ